MLRLGLCCIFRKADIHFRTTTAAYLSRIEDPMGYITEIVESNLENLSKAIEFCSKNGIGAFRISSRLLPLYTHPEFGYELEDISAFKKIKKEAKEKDIRLTFHPDQFVVLSSPRADVVSNSIAELEYHGLMAHLLEADVINIHAGGGYGDKKAALKRFEKNFKKLSKRVQSLLTVENDDRVFTPSDLLPLCHILRIPFVYDVHHHRCLSDELSIEQATKEALKTWKNREPLFHISSPKGGWRSKNPKLHHDYINPADVPACWKKIDPLTIDVEAKEKELAVLRLLPQLL